MRWEVPKAGRSDSPAFSQQQTCLHGAYILVQEFHHKQMKMYSEVADSNKDYEKNEARSESRSPSVGNIVTEGHSEEMTFKQKAECSEGGRQEAVQREKFLERHSAGARSPQRVYHAAVAARGQCG